MALPIKPNNTQEGCNPISSNCVIWQGPDIPCLRLCYGDSVSDVVANMAERLCTITDQLDISLLDLSCFNPIYPTPKDFQDVMQLILNKICALENPTTTPGAAPVSGCPDDCIITIAPCFQERDFLGNLITTLSLKDYAIKIGNEVCTIITDVASNTAAIAALDTRVTYIEDNCCNTTPAVTNITSNGCVGNGSTQPIQTFVLSLETAFCNFQDILGGVDGADAQATIQNLCLTGRESQLNNPSSPLSAIAGWTANVTNISQALQNLYLAVCDMREYVSTTIPALQSSITQCCGASCADIVYSIHGQGIVAVKYLNVTFTGDPIPAVFDYCPTVGSSRITVGVMGSAPGPWPFNSSVGTYDIIDAINNNSTIQIDVTSLFLPAGDQSIWYDLRAELCVTDGTLTCSSNRSVIGGVYNTSWCTSLGATITSAGVGVGTGNVVLSFNGGLAPDITTTYTAQLYEIGVGAVGSPVTVMGGSYTWSPLTSGGVYQVEVRTIQTSSTYGPKDVTCTTNTITVQTA